MVARQIEPERYALYEVLGVSVVSAVSWRVARIEQLLCTPTFVVMATLGNGEVLLMEYVWQPGNAPGHKRARCSSP